MAAAVAVLCLAGSTSTALAANTLSGPVFANGDLVVDKTASLGFSGNFDDTPETSYARLDFDVNSPSVGCAETESLNDERKLASGSQVQLNRGPFADARLQWTPETPGSYVLCAYVFDDYPATTFAKAQVPITVRPPTTTLALALPGDRFRADATVPLQITAFAEVARGWSVEVNPVGVPCGPNLGANLGQSLISDRDVLGGPATTTENITMPADGHYHLCGWVGKRYDDTTPTTIIDGPTFWTGPNPKCSLGKAPSSPTGRVKISCVSVDGAVTITAKRGKKRFTTTVALIGGIGSVKGRALGLKRNTAVTVQVAQGDRKLGARTLRVKRAKKRR